MIVKFKRTLKVDNDMHELSIYPPVCRILRIMKRKNILELSLEANPTPDSGYQYRSHWWRNKKRSFIQHLDATTQYRAHYKVVQKINKYVDTLIKYAFSDSSATQGKHILVTLKVNKSYTRATLKFHHQVPSTETLVSKTKFVLDDIDLSIEYDENYNRIGEWDEKTNTVTYHDKPQPKKDTSEVEPDPATTSTIGKAFRSLYARDVEPRGFAALAGRIAVAPPPTKTDIEQEIRSRILSVVDEIVNKIVDLTDLSVEGVSPHVYVESNEINEYSPITKDITIGIAPTLVKHLNLLGITKEQIFGDDETDTESETDNEPVAVSEVSEPESVEITPVAEAQESILDKVKIPELPNVEDYGMGAGRVTVKDKALINCESDLNQLVPFKYSWAWQGYLKGTEHHWMPQEIELQNDDWGRATAAETKTIMSALFNLKCWSLFKSRDPLLQIYEFITNPEVRQYILRQRFEHTIWGNFVTHVIDTYNTFATDHTPAHFALTDEQLKSYNDFYPIEQKWLVRNDMLDSFCTGEYRVTENIQSMAHLIRFLINFYVNHVFVFNYASIIQVLGYKYSDWGNNPNCKYEGLVRGMEFLFRDVVLQLSIGLSVIKNIIDENPKLREWLTEDSAWYVSIANARSLELEYMDHWANAQSYKTTLDVQNNTLEYMVNLITNNIGLTNIQLDSTNCAVWFIEMFNRFNPTYTKQTTLLEDNNSGSAALSWDDEDDD